MVDEVPQSDPTELRALVGSFIGDAEVAGLDAPVLHALGSVALERMMFGRSAGLSSFGGKRNLFDVLGYDDQLTYREYRGRYRRGGLAKRVVDVYPNAVWRAGAEVYEDENAETETAFELAWQALEAQLGAWNRFQRAHKLALLSTYSVLLIGAPGLLSDELPKGKPGGLLYLRPMSGGGGPSVGSQQMLDGRSNAVLASCSIQSFETNPESPRYGEPLMYQMKQASIPADQLSHLIHYSRVIHVADDLLDDEVYGTPALESVWNLLDDLYKVEGGGSEAFWLRAKNAMHVDFAKTMGFPSSNKPGAQLVAGLTPDQRKSFEEKAQKLQHQIDSVMVTRGATINQLSSATANFKDPVDAITQLIAGTKAIPKRILVGSEMGQLASGQDKDNWNTQVQDKRTSWAFPSVVKLFVDRCVKYGYLPKPKEFHVEWPVIEDLTEDEKVKLQLDMANVNHVQQAVVYTEEEIREVTGREPLTDAQSGEGLSEMQKAEIAAKLALTNKEMGITVFTDDEIRKVTYGFAPLSDAEKVPIGAPEKISVTAPPELGEDGQPIAQPEAPPSPDAKPLIAAQLKALEQAIEDDDLVKIAELIGVTHG
jgi:hypothetical protein